MIHKAEVTDADSVVVVMVVQSTLVDEVRNT
jgi:hypothetical protein